MKIHSSFTNFKYEDFILLIKESDRYLFNEYLVNKILEKRQIGKSETEELSKEENEEKEVKEDDNEVKFDLCCF